MKRWITPFALLALTLVLALLSHALMPGVAMDRLPTDQRLLPASKNAAWVKDRIRSWLPTTHERMWEKVAWTVGIRNSIQRAKALHRPILLFSYAGCIEGRL